MLRCHAGPALVPAVAHPKSNPKSPVSHAGRRREGPLVRPRNSSPRFTTPLGLLKRLSECGICRIEIHRTLEGGDRLLDLTFLQLKLAELVVGRRIIRRQGNRATKLDPCLRGTAE